MTDGVICGHNAGILYLPYTHHRDMGVHIFSQKTEVWEISNFGEAYQLNSLKQCVKRVTSDHKRKI